MHGVLAARVVLITIDRVPNEWGLRRVPQVLDPDGRVALALMISRTAQSPNEQVAGDGYLTINAGMMSRVVLSLGKMLRNGRQLDLSVYRQQGEAIPAGLGGLGDTLHAAGCRTAAIGSPEALGLVMDHTGSADTVDMRVLQPTTEDRLRARKIIDHVDVAVLDASKMIWHNEASALQWLHLLVNGLGEATPILVCCPNPPSTRESMLWPPTWVVLLHAPGVKGALYSPSTRRAGLIVNTDLGATILAWLGHTAQVGNGRACRVRGLTSADTLLKLDAGLRRRSQWRSPLFLGYVVALAITLLILGLVGVLRRYADWRRWRSLTYLIALLIPASLLAFALTGLKPTGFFTLATEIGLGILLALLVIITGGRHRLLSLWITAGFVMVCCLYLAPQWALFNQFSYVVLNSSRYYGLGNAGSGLVTAGALAFAVLGAGHLRRSMRVLGLLAPWLVAVWTFWGHGAANFGMGVATAVLPVAVTVALAPRAARLKWGMALGGVAVLLLGGLTWLDIASGAPSHIGKLVLDIGHHGLTPLLVIVERKLATAWLVLRISPFTFVWEGALFALVVCHTNMRDWLAGSVRGKLLFSAGLATALAAFLLNDSGIEPAAIITTCVVTGLISLAAAEQPLEKTPWWAKTPAETR